jgi:predicted alpha/beta hydrolase family esterase
MAADWGALAVGVGAVGHINGESGLGDWPDGLAWLARLGR